MLKYRNVGLATLVAFSVVFSAVFAEEPVASVADLGKPQMEFLSRTARRTLRDSFLRRSSYQPEYIPAQLEGRDAEVIVRLRRRGRLIGSGAAGPAPLAIATRDASLTAAQMFKADADATLDDLNATLVEIEVIGASELFPTPEKWLEPRALDEFIEPGIHGLAIQSKTRTTRICPTEFLTNDRVVSDALKDIAPTLHDAGANAADVQLSRFRSQHWYEPESNAGIVNLQRGMRTLSLDEVTADRLDESINLLAEYMIYRQTKSGLFSYQYDPALDRYSNEDNLVRQAGAASAMALHAKWSGRSGSEAAAQIAIEHHMKGLMDIPALENAAFISTLDGDNKLGVTALLAIAMADFPKPERFAKTREKLVNGMLWLQRPSGMFITAFPPAAEIESQDYFPGEALLAMAMQYEIEPTSKVLEAFDLSIGFYRGYFKGDPSPAFVPWQTQAYALMAHKTKRADYANFVYELTDWLAGMQLDAKNCEWPDLWGGVASYQPGRAGVSTAAYLEGFAAALTLAKATDQKERVEKYEKAVRAAARFVMQLQVRPEEAYFIRSPQDAIGGIRTAPALYQLRIDHCQHALVALIKTRQALYGDRG